MIEYVTKAEAWDALTRVPPKAQKELDQLRPIAETARDLVLHCGRHVPERVVCVNVPIEIINKLRGHFGMDDYE